MKGESGAAKIVAKHVAKNSSMFRPDPEGWRAVMKEENGVTDLMCEIRDVLEKRGIQARIMASGLGRYALEVRLPVEKRTKSAAKR